MINVRGLIRFLCWSLLLAAAGADCGRCSAQTTATPQLAYQAINGQHGTGKLEELSEQRVKISGKAPLDVPTRELIRIDWPQRSAAELGGKTVILPANGDRLVAEIIQSNEEALTARWTTFSGLEDFAIPLEMVQAVAWKLPEDRTRRSRILKGLRRDSNNTDLLILRNGNSLAGEFLGFEDNTLQWQSTTGERTFSKTTLRSLRFNPELIDFPDSQGLRLIVSTVDGSRFIARKFALKPDVGLELTTAFGATVRLALDRIVSMQVLGGRAVYLSDLQPRQYTFTPYLSLRWPLQTDRNVAGDLLRLDGREFFKGLGTHSRSEITYELNGGYRTFQARVGIDDRVRGGHAIVEVALDGKTVLQSQPLIGGEPSISLGPIDVAGAQQLTLLVKFGEQADVLDHVNWCDALLVTDP